MRYAITCFALLLGPLALGCSVPDPSLVFRCTSCLSSTDCGGSAQCVQYAFDTACAPPCDASGSCVPGTHCAPYSSTAGEQVMVCVPDTAMCGMSNEDTGTPDMGPITSCGGLIAPMSPSTCVCSPGHPCTPNGCYGGWWCNAATSRCQTPPTSCGTMPDAGPPRDAGPPTDAGPLPMGTVGPNGGTVSSLFFGVLGDSRPAIESSGTAGYPTAIVTRLYQDLEGLSPRPQFAVVTGDYCFANTFSTGAHQQMGLYLGARQMFSNTVFYAMGNHECTGGTASNCGSGNANGITNNYTAFLSDMLGPLGQSQPYYSFRVDSTTPGAWTSKFIFAAPNAWDANQAAFIQSALAQPTTYTFLISHEPPTTTSGPPGLAPLQALIASSPVPVTLHITGHSHTYYHSRGTNTVTIGLGGAPPSGSYDYGYLTVTQLATGDIEVAEYGYMSGTRGDIFRLHADGSAAP